MYKRIEYYYLPKKFRRKHDYCEFVITEIEKFIIDETFEELKKQTIKLPENSKITKDNKEHIFDLLRFNGLKTELEEIVRNQLLFSLIMFFWSKTVIVEF